MAFPYLSLKSSQRLVFFDKTLIINGYGKQEANDKRNRISAFLASFRDKGGLIADFNEELFNIMVNKAVVNRDRSIEFIFNSGYKVKVVAWE